ncbi:class I SAM-dependent methyltransferase [Gramella lutea]|uniref:Class I SAM-dependent methyltransferase n=1 Tax=Christiangramia lutea TaxID=1607951 RepID=A0A9X1V0Z9_9FLAO|nr:methyltransferase domain-containing protein [Christiangramia lutea]MCH4822079.1 class I SAM-dependent methyltransferase [Christiangramia lutea]
MESIQKTEQIFNKYAIKYEKKYMDVSLYAEYLDVFLQQIEPGKRKILDVGCGPGNVSSYLLEKREDLEIQGIDISRNMVNLARKNNPFAQFKVLDGRELFRLREKYDGVVAAFFLPYLSKNESLSFIEKCSNILKKDGVLFISTMEAPNEKSGYEGSESADEELYINYHEAGYLVEALKENQMKLKAVNFVKNPSNKAGVRDLIITALK